MAGERARHSVAAAVGAQLLLGTSACGTDPDGPHGDDVQGAAVPSADPGAVATSESALVFSTEYYWEQSQSWVDMGTSTGRICFLTGVSGSFRGGGERVRIDLRSGRWYLGGASQQHSVSARARCVNVSHHDGLEYSWAQEQTWARPTLMGTTLGRACFLTGMQGRFESGHESVDVWKTSSGEWALAGFSSQVGVMAWARCAYVPWYSRSSWWDSRIDPLFLGTLEHSACFLTRVAGGFFGERESVRTYLTGSHWYVGGETLQSFIAANAACVVDDGNRMELVRDWGFEEQSTSTIGPPWATEGPGAKGISSEISDSHTGNKHAYLRATSGWNAMVQDVPVSPNATHNARIHVNSYNVNGAGYFGVRDPYGGVLASTTFGQNRTCYIFSGTRLIRYQCPTGYEAVTLRFSSYGWTSVRLFVGYYAPGSDSWLRIDNASVTRE